MISIRSRILGLVSDRRGAVLVLVAAGMFFMIGMAGLALDSGRGYLARLQLTRAVDSAALTGARTLRAGQSAALAQARAAAYANGLVEGVEGASLDMSISTDPSGESTFEVSAGRTVPTTLMRLLGIDHVDVAATAVASVPPVDLILVIDQSTSLGMVGAWGDLQRAAKQFVAYFSDDIDQVGLVSFNTRAADRFQISKNFTVNVQRSIDGMSSAGWTNYGEGLRLAYNQITSSDVRDRSAKVVVFFTDGRPTAFRGTVGGRDRILATAVESPPRHIGSYYDNPDAVPMDYTVWGPCRNVTFCPQWTEQGPPQAEASDAINHDVGRQYADMIRGEGVLLYTIGLGNTDHVDPAVQPNPDFLRELANVDGNTNARQPAGKFYFAPTAAELQAVFNQVAQDLLVRLAK